MKNVAVIPVKESSERVKDKNFREFTDGLSITELKVRQLLESGVYDEIYISSDSEKAREIAEENGIIFIKRPVELCNNVVSWSDVIFHVVSSLPVNDNTSVSWCHTTSPIFKNYKDAVEKYHALDKNLYDGLVTVTDFNDFLLNDKGRPYNYNWGVWHEYSQYLDKLYMLTGALFIAEKSEMLKNRYVISRKPFMFGVSKVESVDIDTEFDFEIAQIFYNKVREANAAD